MGNQIKTDKKFNNKSEENSGKVIDEHLDNIHNSPTKEVYKNGDKLIGNGLFSKVYLSHNKGNSDQLYAAKRISKQKIIKEHILNNIYNEKYILSSLDNEFIIRLLAIEQNEKKIFMFFNYYKYGDLFFYLKYFKNFSEEITKFIIIQVYFALEYMHSKNIIYRDLKPENIIIDDDGYIKIIDLGLAKQLSDDNNKIFEICGTNEFIPPEVIENNNYSFNFDWWGFGILTYELLIGKPPFTGKNQKEIFKNIRKKELDFEHCGVRKTKSVFNKLIQNIGFIKNKQEDPISEQAKNFIELLLRKDPDERMYPTEILKHAFFKDYDYEAVKHKKVESPLKLLIEENKENIQLFFECNKAKKESNDHKYKKKKKGSITEIDNGILNYLNFQ